MIYLVPVDTQVYTRGSHVCIHKWLPELSSSGRCARDSNDCNIGCYPWLRRIFTSIYLGTLGILGYFLARQIWYIIEIYIYSSHRLRAPSNIHFTSSPASTLRPPHITTSTGNEQRNTLIGQAGPRTGWRYRSICIHSKKSVWPVGVAIVVILHWSKHAISSSVL